ncbi:hypothetical protein V7O66_03300 [Methanolobus sp. ZRKC3]|uniref:hypothetical protein n=1 Tax=Methanolobus sp. ZRKC3 TaxID=3125786 RepID=UPI0032437881
MPDLALYLASSWEWKVAVCGIEKGMLLMVFGSEGMQGAIGGDGWWQKKKILELLIVNS